MRRSRSRSPTSGGSAGPTNRGLLDRRRSSRRSSPGTSRRSPAWLLGGRIADPTRFGARRRVPGGDGRPGGRPASPVGARSSRRRPAPRRRRRRARDGHRRIAVVVGGLVGPLGGLARPSARAAPSRPTSYAVPGTTRARRRGRGRDRGRPGRRVPTPVLPTDADACGPDADDRAMSIELVGLAFLMFLVTYPSRALGAARARHRPAAADRPRLPAARRAGGARGARGGQRHGRHRRRRPAAHPVGVEWLAVLACLGGRACGGGTCSSGSWSPSADRRRRAALGGPPSSWLGVERRLSARASTSISTSRLGSMSAATWTRVAAGRTSREHRAVDARRPRRRRRCR